MPKATLTLTIPDEIWIGEITRRYADAKFQVLAALAGAHTGVGLAKITGPDIESVVTDLEDYDAVTDIKVLVDHDRSISVQIETKLPILLEPAKRSGIPLEMPFTVQSGQVVWELTTSRDRLSALHDELNEFGIPFNVDSIYQEIDTSQFLTDHQWTVLEAAVREGYYDTPRTCTQEDLAEKLNVAKSTCSETLHRAEERIIKEYVGNQTDVANQQIDPYRTVA